MSSSRTIPRMSKVTSSWREQDGARTRSRTARAFANWIRSLHQSRPVSACSECPGSRRTAACALIAQYNGVPPGDGTDRLPVTMRQVLSKRLTIRGFINYDFAAEHYADFLREVGAGVAAGRIRYREDIIDGLENAPGAFIGMLEGRNFGKLIVRVAA